MFTGLIALVLGAGGGYWIADLRWQSEEARKNASQARQETERLEKALADNQALRMTVDDLNTRYRKENDEAKRKNDALLARINRGDVRVSVAARSCSELPDSGRTGTDSGKARAELDQEVVERILSVGRDGDAAIRDLNLCVEQYQVVAEVYYK